MIIFGVDPGMAITGWGIISERQNSRLDVLSYGSIQTQAHQPVPKRLKIIHDEIHTLLIEFKPDVVAVEQLFFMHNTTSRLGVGQARGVVLYTAEELSLPTVEYAPKVIKQAVTGYGSAGKDQMTHMIKSLLNLKSVPKPDDVGDALAVAVCHAQSYKMNKIGLFA